MLPVSVCFHKHLSCQTHQISPSCNGFFKCSIISLFCCSRSDFEHSVETLWPLSSLPPAAAAMLSCYTPRKSGRSRQIRPTGGHLRMLHNELLRRLPDVTGSLWVNLVCQCEVWFLDRETDYGYVDTFETQLQKFHYLKLRRICARQNRPVSCRSATIGEILQMHWMTPEPGIANRTFGNRIQSNSIEPNPSIEFHWVRQSNEIEHRNLCEYDFRTNRTQSNKIEPYRTQSIRLCSIEFGNRTQSNSINWRISRTRR